MYRQNLDFIICAQNVTLLPMGKAILVKEIQFESLQEYLEIAEGIPREWGIHPSGLWYRGSNDMGNSLVPGCVWRKIELELEASCVAEFLVHYRSYYKQTISDPLELYCLMQHYGLPTRLLDWSSSPLVSLYFSLEGEPPIKPGVWLMSPVDLNKITIDMESHVVPKQNIDHCYTKPWLPKFLRDGETDAIPKVPFAFKHPLVNPRISAQKGSFTFHGSDKRGIENYFEESNNNCLIKLVLKDNDKRKEILHQLYTLGFKEDDIYQDLNSLTRRILREHSILIGNDLARFL